MNPGRAEICDALLVDENCNGGANEGCGCVGIGSSRSCCSGRGQQLCEAVGSGSSYSACDAPITRETCNGVDDDCDGLVDDLEVADGGADAGEFGASCSVGIGACRRTAALTCSSGALSCPIDAGVPSIEQCNGIDDDCNGQVDEGSLCSITGQQCVSGACACPQGQSVCGSACVTLGGSCSAGLGECRRGGVSQCVGGAVQCSAVPGTPVTEVCNGRDDDCDGLIDEAGPQLCGATGQACSGGVCSCPSGQSVCGSACVTLGVACTAGLGECRRSGVGQCTGGAVQCSAVPGTPATEVCNGRDDDCDGSTDEAGPQLCSATGQSCGGGVCSCPSGQGVCGGACVQLVQCLVDADGDRYAAGATSSTHCPDPSRQGSAGGCPVGFVAPTSSLGTDCDDGNANAWQVLSSRVDADGDGACTGQSASACVGATPPAGRRLTTSCAAEDDCNDLNASQFRVVAIAADSDGDRSCAGPLTGTCIGASVPAGFATSCLSTTDCNDASAALFQVLSVRTDQDGDGRCVGNAIDKCSGAAPAAGLRLAASCLATDCNDTSSALYQMLSLRADQDGDGACAGNVIDQCSGATPAPGLRLAATCPATDCNDASAADFQVLNVRTDADQDGSCVGAVFGRCSGATPSPGYRVPTACTTYDDCNDANFSAAEICTMSWASTTASKTCGIGPPPVEFLSVSSRLPSSGGCPTGFRLANLSAALLSGIQGSCQPSSPTQIQMSCPTAAFGSFQCELRGVCTAF